MSKSEDLARMGEHYHWWPKGKAIHLLHELAQQMREAPDNARLTLRMGMKADGALNPWLCVEGGETYEGFNDSFGCPPLC